MNVMLPDRQIIAIDLKSFFAACECLERGLDLYSVPLIVCHPTQRGALTLAVTPYLKSLGIQSRTRVYNLPKNIKYIKAPPRMGLYSRKSKEVVEVYKEFISSEDMHIYSIDEVFLDVTCYLNLYKIPVSNLAINILKKIKEKTGLTAVAGIGPNVYLAKVAMDTEAKKNKNNIATWSYNDVENKLWKITPLSKIWGIGSKTEEKLNIMKMFTMKDIANADKNILKSKFGVYGTELWNRANGIDFTKIADLNKEPKNKSYSSSQMLYQDYYKEGALLVIRENIELLSRRLRENKKRAANVGLDIVYSKSVGGGFSKTISFDQYTRDSKEIFHVCLSIFDNYYNELPIRQVSIRLGNLVDDIGEQLNIFQSYDESCVNNQCDKAIDHIKNKYGNNSLLKASSLLDHSMIVHKNDKKDK